MTRVAIIGVGLIGGSLGLALREARPDIEVIGIARSEDSAAAAVKRGAVTAAGADLRLASACDLVVVATPLQEMRPVFSRLGRELPKQTLVTDVGSVKRAVLDWARELIPDAGRFLGGHPMAGKSESGLRAAEVCEAPRSTLRLATDGRTVMAWERMSQSRSLSALPLGSLLTRSAGGRLVKAPLVMMERRCLDAILSAKAPNVS